MLTTILILDSLFFAVAVVFMHLSKFEGDDTGPDWFSTLVGWFFLVANATALVYVATH